MIDLPTYAEQRGRVWHNQRRPYIILKWAETADGFIAPAHHQPYWISNDQARQLVHRWRSEEAAIWVGKRTYQRDNPHLNVREWDGPDPVRIVLDPQLQLNPQLHVFDQSQATLCYNYRKSKLQPNLEFVRFSEEIDSWKDWVAALLADLYQRQLSSLFVEGGTILLSFLLENNWWDEARVFRTPTTFGEGVAAPSISEDRYVVEQEINDNTLTIYRP